MRETGHSVRLRVQELRAFISAQGNTGTGTWGHVSWNAITRVGGGHGGRQATRGRQRHAMNSFVQHIDIGSEATVESRLDLGGGAGACECSGGGGARERSRSTSGGAPGERSGSAGSAGAHERTWSRCARKETLPVRFDPTTNIL